MKKLEVKKSSPSLDAAVVLASLEQEAAPLFKRLKAISIEDKNTYTLKSEKADKLKQIGKLAEAKEKSLTDPLTKVIKDIRALFAPLRKKIESAEIETKAEMVKFIEASERKIEKVKEQLGDGTIVKLETAAKKISQLEISAPTSKIVKRWVAVEVDASLTPREFMVPNMSAITEALRAGKKVNGWEWKQQTNIAI